MNFKFINFIKKHELWLVFVFSIVLSFLVFGNGISGEFVFDDVTVIQNRGDLTNPDNFFSLWVYPYHQNMPKTGLYRPLTMASYALNHFIFGSSPVSFHIVNIILHALNSFLVFLLVKYLLKSGRIAFLSFILFLFHPIHTEAVTSIVGRAELLAFFWSILTIYSSLKGRKILAGIFLLLALASKESALMILPMMFFIEWLWLGKKFYSTVIKFIYFSIPLAVYSVLRYIALGRYFTGDITTTIIENQLKFVGWPVRVFTATKVFFMYLEKLLWPINLSADYSYNTIKVVTNLFNSWQSITGLMVLFILIMALVLPRTRKSILALGVVIFLFPYLIISNLIFPIGTIMGERLMYFPSLGFAIISSFWLAKLIEKIGVVRKLGYLVLIGLICFYGVRTFIRNKDWQSHRTLFTAALAESPDGLITSNALAGIHMRSNEWDKAKEQLEISKGIYEDNALLQNLLGIVADHDGNYILAEEKFKRSLELNPDMIVSDINLAELYLKQSRFEEAGRHFLKVINFYATTEQVLRYAYIQITIGKPDEALAIIDKYFGSKPLGVDAVTVVGTAYFVKRDYEKALIFLKKARELGNKAPEIEEMIRISEVN
ncbi:MAG: hypothetical protein A3B86_00345 [Candidatus Yanofskybacteria bacterium RIFCSPHIGHO2_02_FULL_38_22b]|uniref:Uncharacterized protein n=1 Tax=Candidatus Yanofskybacteria bacterium RIFCSPHIGHO2_02_FULL_38_22b TaxID=1802673 RepID=A0A1F8F217_9BACT|nr:MAG: hypothetical protein A2816_02820 [Candidatus Yanofskybacteria bacterium RIFCSPHIGHO2_01_FULL_39_44]OGN06630.1 MAG: hypothetical protein A3B86_00345 [Candidatus Yanofskybacteria bacterium RIFCSPHIGHO2_02_FULL_38_22b]OGN20560.1 MAG: hypothetical protein A2910_01730 [Candidatus Yanofskybacteria bacterium RIFCSPLOWO2_01_FULL_39_28]